MYEFEQNKKNNLILYGVTAKHPETSESLRQRISNLFRDHLNIRRDINIQKATRILQGQPISQAVFLPEGAALGLRSLKTLGSTCMSSRIKWMFSRRSLILWNSMSMSTNLDLYSLLCSLVTD